MTYDKRKRAEGRIAYRSQTCSWDCWTWGTILGIGGGIAAVVAGSVLTAVAWFAGGGSYAGTVGTILLFAMIPLLFVGALSLDMEERRKKRTREAAAMKTGNH
jgi:NhaP-type Na+/H+ or K+/H+ antiporter